MRGPGSMVELSRLYVFIHFPLPPFYRGRTTRGFQDKFCVEDHQFAGQIRDLGHNIDENFEWMAKVHSNLPAKPILGR